ncbi:MAG: ligase-associated DNA damage response DEXH box helicase [Burkholderiales bacterium]|nr:ligase-associated DNA damage response DEXH box helicase [Burkholderiales bacterium]
MRRLPPGPNVGTQLRARRLKQAREAAKRQAAAPAAAAGRPDRRPRAVETGQLALPSAEAWFAAHRIVPFAFQREVWHHVAAGRSGLLHATTGAGKTYAVHFGLLDRALAGEVSGGGLRLLWVTPMRALAADTARALALPLADLGLAWQVGVRTGDTAAAERARQGRKLPEVLVTTPESLSLLLARADSRELFARLALAVVDEWHELIGSKRGVQVQLALARLRRFAPRLPVWGLSATLGNLDEAMGALLARDDGVLVRGRIDKPLAIDTLLPDEPGRFPWGGHLGIRMLEPVLREIAAAGTTLVFTNTRSQAEIWYQAILEARPQWAGLIALHHGSLDREVRDWVEAGLKDGRLKAVVATSSLDLGVDFLPVERVLQVGSAKGVARLLQRAGRSGHAPGRLSRATLVPTNALELIEASAARKAAAAGRVETRSPPAKPLDVLVQHVVTVALGGGFAAAELLAEVRSTASFATLTDDEWNWVLDFAGRGGASLAAYPQYRRIAPAADGLYRVPDAQVARRHRMSVGTIVADAAMLVRLRNGTRLGHVEESFIARLRKGDVFTFAGRRLELVRVHEMTAFVAPARTKRGTVPRWAGTKMPLSSELADAVLAELDGAAAGRLDTPELKLTRPLLELQARWSALPGRDCLLVESLRHRDGHSLFVYPFAGRHANLGLASLVAWRVGGRQPATFSIAVNDYGFELLAAQAIDWRTLWAQAADADHGLLREAGLLDDVLASLNAGELAQRRFREIARVAGLIFQGFPGQLKPTRQLQASSQLFYEVFRRHDAGNLLLTQAEREVLEQELELARLRAALARMRAMRLAYRHLQQPTPFAFALLVERLREQLSTEELADRIARMVAELERRAAADD